MLKQQLKYQTNYGVYSAQSYGESSNTNIKYDNSSSSMSLISRKMLTADEVLRIQSPIILVMIAGEYSAILYVPDISKMYFNKLNGMGTKEENKKLRIKREEERPIREIQKVKIWNIWDEINNMDEEDFEERQNLKELRENWRVSRKRRIMMNKNKEKIKTAIKIGLRIILFVVLLFAMQQIVHAASFEETKLVIGTQNLVNAVIKWLTGIGITICGGYFIYYVYCLKTNDEGERRRNMQNIKTTLISMVLITCGLALIDVILGFYR